MCKTPMNEEIHTVPAMRPKIGALEMIRDNSMAKSPFVHQIFYQANQPTHDRPRSSRVELCPGSLELSKKRPHSQERAFVI